MTKPHPAAGWQAKYDQLFRTEKSAQPQFYPRKQRTKTPTPTKRNQKRRLFGPWQPEPAQGASFPGCRPQFNGQACPRLYRLDWIQVISISGEYRMTDMELFTIRDAVFVLMAHLKTERIRQD
ncbi:uncharacterized protein UV8b_01623 [Ustilaginoidea virens]|uniref:Uncharacterized protein n=1 Tax=Ustilaginoidea virens TaxID=1159556 RepID=A0A8E5HLA5_USTVR|nr:uncharacterized protein UV8b_01623 [Ustilaginoidea virens]QUC17382.1 hypothetical protein UV8b_01623 [Ustilaginoidea virens]